MIQTKMSDADSGFDTEAAEEMRALIAAIKKKHAAKAVTLVSFALKALVELDDLEREMDREALRIHRDYRDVPDAKLTFETAYHEPALAGCLRVVRSILRDAMAARGSS
jgi:hypothetical protein